MTAPLSSQYGGILALHHGLPFTIDNTPFAIISNEMFFFCSADVDKLKNLILHNAIVLTLAEKENHKDEVIPKNVQQFWVRHSLNFIYVSS